MNTIRTAGATRTRAAATAAVLIGIAVALAGCSGGNASAAGNGSENSSSSQKAPSADGAWVAVDGTQSGDVVSIKGDKISYIHVNADHEPCSVTKQVISDPDGTVAAGEKDGQFEVMSSGVINPGRSTVLWDDVNGVESTGDDAGSGTISITADQISLEYTFYRGVDPVMLVPADSAQGKAFMDGGCS